jgi:hypothetical protein
MFHRCLKNREFMRPIPKRISDQIAHKSQKVDVANVDDLSKVEFLLWQSVY